MCVRDHGCGLHALHNGEWIPRIPQQLEEPYSKTGAVTNMGGREEALRSRKHSTVSAGVSWWTGAVPKISKVLVPWTIWVVIGTVAVGKTIGTAVIVVTGVA